MKSLKYFRLKGTTLNLANIASLAEHSSNLIAIDFHINVSTNSATEISTAFKSFFEKVALTLKSFKCEFDGVEDILLCIKYLHHCQRLEDVEIKNEMNNYLTYLSTLKNLKCLRFDKFVNFNYIEECLKKIDLSQLTELHIDSYRKVDNQFLINIMERKWPSLKVFTLINGILDLTEDMINVILEKCPMLEVLILPWKFCKLRLTDEYMYRLLTQTQLKLFRDSEISYTHTLIKQLKKYEVHHIPPKQRVLGDVNTQDICTFKSHSDFRQKYVHIDKDIFGVKSRTVF